MTLGSGADREAIAEAFAAASDDDLEALRRVDLAEGADLPVAHLAVESLAKRVEGEGEQHEPVRHCALRSRLKWTASLSSWARWLRR